MSLIICKNDSVQVRYMELEDAYPSQYISRGDYRLEVSDGTGTAVHKTDFNVAFFLMTNPPTAVDCSPINMRIQFLDSMKHISIYRKDTKIFSRDLALCNDNGICNLDYETFLSCPRDCPLDRNDGICQYQGDGVCDPDCDPGTDPDCATPPTTREVPVTSSSMTTTTQARPTGSSESFDIFLYLPYVLVLIVLVIAAYLIHNKRENAKIKEEREKFLKWKEKQDKGGKG